MLSPHVALGAVPPPPLPSDLHTAVGTNTITRAYMVPASGPSNAAILATGLPLSRLPANPRLRTSSRPHIPAPPPPSPTCIGLHPPLPGRLLLHGPWASTRAQAPNPGRLAWHAMLPRHSLMRCASAAVRRSLQLPNRP